MKISPKITGFLYAVGACALIAVGVQAIWIQQREFNSVETLVDNGAAYTVWRFRALAQTPTREGARVIESNPWVSEARKHGWELVSADFRPGKHGGWFVKMRKQQDSSIQHQPPYKDRWSWEKLTKSLNL